MADCAHGFLAPDALLASLPICQAGAGRHKCAVCAYARGLDAGQGKTFPGPLQECAQGHADAPVTVMDALPVTQAGIHRHRCAYKAYELGKSAGSLLSADAEASLSEQAEMVAIINRTDIESTQKEQLILARRGQGTFRDRVTSLMGSCLVTGIADTRLLIASHIKPWRQCTDQERLDGYNGLLLSPHADRLFDRGWLTFDETGSVLRSQEVPTEVWTQWGLDTVTSVSALDAQYQPYLEHHRTHIFRK